jgi:hypothetical protein
VSVYDALDRRGLTAELSQVTDMWLPAISWRVQSFIPVDAGCCTAMTDTLMLGFDPRTVQPVASRYTDWATRPTHLDYSIIK